MTLDNAGNTLVTARRISPTSAIQTFTDSLGANDSNDFYSFSLNSRSSLNIVINNLTADVDARIVRDINSNGIVDESSEVIISSYQNRNWNESIETFLDAGNYFIQVSPTSGANTDYALSINSLPVTSDLAGNTLTSGRRIVAGSIRTTFTDWVGSTDTDDYYRFDLSQNSRVNLAFKSLSPNLNMQLFDISGRMITSSLNLDFIEEITGSITSEVNTGSYVIRVFSPTSANYELNVAATPVAPLDLAGNSLTTARQISVGAAFNTFTDWVGAADTNDYYRFTLSETLNFSLSLHGLSANADVQLLDNIGNLITASTNAGSTNDFISRQLTAGSYFIRVLPTVGANTNYSLVASAVPRDFAGNSTSNARLIDVGSTTATYTDWVGTFDTNDYYRFTLNQNSNFNLSLNGLSADANVELLDGATNSVIVSSNALGISSELINRQLNTGSYFIRVFPAAGANTNYNLSVSATPLVSDTDGTPSGARLINVGSTTTTFTSSIGGADANDYYRFTVNQNSSFNLSLTGLSGDANVELINSSTNQVISSSITSGTSNEAINSSLSVGTYFIRVFPAAGANTNYNLNVAAIPDFAGNTLATARQISVGSTTTTFTDWVGAADTNDYYRFTLTQNSSLNLSLNGMSADADVQLIDSVTNSVIASSLAGGATSESINSQLNAGTYLIRVFSATLINTYYNLNVAAIPDLAGNTLATARQISFGSTTTTFTDWVGAADTNDYYRFSLNQNSNLNLSLNGLIGDANVELIDSSTNFVIASSNALGMSSELINRQLNTGSYFIRVFPTTGANTNYNLSVSATPIIPADLAGNTQTTARQINVGSTTTTFTDWVGATDTNDYYRFSLNQNSNLNLSLNGLSADANVELIDSSTNFVIASSNALGISSEFINRQLNAGSYFIRVFPTTGANTNYNLNVTAIPDFAGNTLATARQITVGSTATTFTDWVGATDTNDYYRFSLNQSSNLNLSLNGLSADANVELIDSSTNFVIASSNALGISSEFINRQLNAGSYFIRVFPTTGANTNYNLNVTAIPDFAGNTLATARQITVGSTATTFTDWVGATDTNDYYRFTLSQTSNINLNLSGLSANADVQLLDNIGNIIISSTASGISNELINRQLNTGNYFIRVFPTTGANTNYNLSVTATASSASFIERVLELVNIERARVGASALRLNSQLNQAAQGHSEEMAIRDYFSHTGYNGSRFSDRILATGYRFSTAGENIAAGQTTPEDVVRSWMNSTTGHRENMLNSAYREMGIGYYFLGNDTGAVNYNHYWTQKFGAPL
jgi:uncharacterized protein YkwD